VRRIWADPTACLLFCASVVIASNNFDSALPPLKRSRCYRIGLSSLSSWRWLLIAGKRAGISRQKTGRTNEFNQWKGLSMTKQPNGMWTIKVSIPPGTYGYKFPVDEKDWVFDPNNPGRKTVDGVENSSIRRSVVKGGAPATP